MNINTNDFKDINPGDRVLMGPALGQAMYPHGRYRSCQLHALAI